MPKKIEKHFPADTTLDQPTFLNDPKVDGELYAYLLSLSLGEEKETRVYKKDLPTQTKIAEYLAPPNGKPLSRQTIKAHLQYLIDHGYMIEKDEYYTIPHKERMYFKMDTITLNFLLDTVKEGVIKTYIYLGQRYNYKPNYSFTIKELCEHLGISYARKSSTVTNWLEALIKFDLIKVETYYEGIVPYYRLCSVNTKYIPEL